MQTCPTCQYESPLGAKFCRQCGAPMLAESELSAASTRNYGRQEPARPVAAAVSAPLPPSVADVISGDTARYYQAPQAVVTPVVNTAPIPANNATILKGARWFVLLLVLCLGMGLGLLFANLQFNQEEALSPEQLAQIDAQAREQALQHEMADRIREEMDRAREAQDRLREAGEHAREAAQQAAEAGAAFAPNNVTPLDLRQYEYPGASTGNYSRIPGNEMVQMRSKESFEKISQYYQTKLGNPLMLMTDGDDKSAFFQSNTTPSVFVMIEADDDHDGLWRITITRAPFHFAQPGAPIAPPAVPAPPAPAKP